MAECCSRCSQERRYIRKELQRWGKSMLLVVGMERVAQELMGGRKWRKLMTPLNCLESKEPQDWTRQETCYFCMSKTKSLNNSIDNVVPNSEDILSSAPGEHCSSCNHVKGENSEINSCKCNLSHSPSSSDQPLDLSVHSRHKLADTLHSDDASDAGDNDHSLIKVPQPSSTAKPNKKTRLQTNSVWKRTYTEEELQAALRDIQSGKLGTRRAAVIYGIPRSTLRNKVYKLALDRSNGKRKVNSANASTKTVTVNDKTKLNTSDDNNKSEDLDDVNCSNSASESLKQILKNAITQRVNNNNVLRTDSNIEKASHLESLIPGINLNEMYNHEALATIQMLSTIDCGNTLAPLFTQFLLNIHQLALAKHHAGDMSNLNNLMTNSNLPLLPELIHKITENRLLGNRDMNQDELEDENGNSNSNVILKVPSYKPKTSSTLTSLSEQSSQKCVTSDNDPVNKCTSSSQQEESKSFSLKEIIAKSISQRLTAPSAKVNCNIAISEDSSSDALINEEKQQTSSDSKNNLSDSNPSTPEKRNRPKRGRYRNYNRDDLAKAVRAVQRGEMSVHRAGTFFGVPHSTLEYKVKERHLLRPKKRNHESMIVNKKENTTKTNVSSNAHSINGTSNSNGGTSPVPNSISSFNSSVSTNLPFWQAAFPFFPIDMASTNTNFFASNMMRKLQENARLNQDILQNNNSSDSNREFGGLLLESLIKSSLDNNNVIKGKNSVKQEDSANEEDRKEDENDNEEEMDCENNNNNNNDDDKDVLNASLEVLKEVSALDKKE